LGKKNAKIGMPGGETKESERESGKAGIDFISLAAAAGDLFQVVGTDLRV